ncbi:unnamed protein product, partial [Meganyctiphanes norvegica]
VQNSSGSSQQSSLNIIRMKNLLLFSVVSAICLLVLAPEATQAEASPAPRWGRGGAFIAGALIGGAIGRRRGRGGCGCRRCCGRKKRGIPDGIISNQILEEMYENIATEDIEQCGLRLICELSQKEDHKLTGQEKLIMLPYSGVRVSDGSKFGLYDEAAWHGQENRECHKLYPLCGFSAPEIMWHTRQMNITEPILTI